MNELNINEETSILDELTVTKPQKSKLFNVLIVSSLCYIIFVLIDLSIDIKRLSTISFHWDLAVTILILPLLGLIFHLTSKKIGWIINCFYYLLISVVVSYTFLQNMYESTTITIEKNGRGLLLLMLTLTSTILLFSNPIRKHFRISKLLLIITACVSIGLAIFINIVIIEK